MTNSEAIEDLKTIKQFFEQESGGAYPVCIDYAIKALEKNKELETDCAWK